MLAEKPVIGAEEEFEELPDGSREGKPEINTTVSEKITSQYQKSNPCSPAQLKNITAPSCFSGLCMTMRWTSAP